MDCLSSEREELCREVERLRQITQSALQEAAEELPPDHNQLWDPPEHHLPLVRVQNFEDPAEHSQPLEHPGNPAEHQLPLVVPVHPDPEELVLIEPMPADKHPTSFKLKRRKLSEFFVHAGCPGFCIYSI